jgi:WD40 repeat protein
LPESHSQEKWFASASSDGSARVFNLAQLFTEEFKESSSSTKVVQVISSVATFSGHGGLRVIALAWSPYDDNLLVTVGYDKTAVVSLDT